MPTTSSAVPSSCSGLPAIPARRSSPRQVHRIDLERRTTATSAALLRYAAEGWCIDPLASYLSHLATGVGQTEQVEQALLDVGHSSGAGLLEGVRLLMTRSNTRSRGVTRVVQLRPGAYTDSVSLMLISKESQRAAGRDARLWSRWQPSSTSICSARWASTCLARRVRTTWWWRSRPPTRRPSPLPSKRSTSPWPDDLPAAAGPTTACLSLPRSLLPAADEPPTWP